MLPPLLYSPTENRNGDLIVLPADEAKHAARVLRLRLGAIIIVVDGQGNACRAEIASITPRKVTAKAHSEIREYGEPSVRLTFAAGLSTGSRFDSVVQKGTELGVSRFVPLVTEKSRVTIAEPKRARIKINRWGKVALAAMKQCRRSLTPEIATPTSFDDFLAQHEKSDVGILFHPGRESVPLDNLDLAPGIKRLTLLVGPESGFTDDECLRAKALGFALVSLGRRILRTETAGPAAIALVMARLGEFR